MRFLRKLLSKLFWSEKDWVEDYLSQSTDHAIWNAGLGNWIGARSRTDLLELSHTMVTNTDNTYTQRGI